MVPNLQIEIDLIQCQEENGSVERYNQTLMGGVRVLLKGSIFEPHWWPEVAHYETYVHNFMPNARLGGISPYQKLHGRKPNYNTLQVWGMVCYAYYPVYNRPHEKLTNRATKCRFIGYSTDHKAYRLWNLEKNTIITSRDVQFLQNVMTNCINLSFINHTSPQLIETDPLPSQINIKSLDTTEKNSSTLHIPTEGVSKEQEKRPIVSEGAKPHQKSSTKIVHKQRPIRQLTKPKRYNDYLCYVNHLQEEHDVQRIPLPRTMREALATRFSQEWKKAMEVEYQALMANGTYILTTLPPGRKALGSRWVYAIKYLVSGTIERFKARLVVKGYNQISGLDYDEIFAPVCRHETIRLILALACIFDWHVHQCDVSTAFLNGILGDDEVIFMKQPEGFIKEGTEHLVCKLKKSLYGLKQASRIWYLTLHKFLTQSGFRRTQKEYCLYVKKEGDMTILLAVYVDDLTLTCSCLDTLNKIKQHIGKTFKITDGGEANFLLKLEIHRDRKNIVLTICQKR